MEQNVEKYTTNLEDGTKLNNSGEFNKNKKITLFRYIKENAKFLLRNKTYFNDSYWPVLKLKNFNMYVPYYMYYLIIKIRLKIKGVL